MYNVTTDFINNTNDTDACLLKAMLKYQNDDGLVLLFQWS